MWHLELFNDEVEVVTHFLVGKTYSVGRKETDITVSNDSSVSRKHCSIQVSSLEEPSLIVSDTSKYGTFYARNVGTEMSLANLKFEQIKGSAHLKAGDLLRIGVLKSVFRVVKSPLVVVTSKLDASTLANIKSMITKLGGKVCSSWTNEATHLCMKAIVLNIKVTQALASSCPIVTENYFKSLLDASTSKSKALPSHENFTPKLVEQDLNEEECSFLPISNRRQLFREKTFVFLSKKQHKRLGETCALAGGTVLLIKSTEFNEKLLDSASTVVLHSHDCVESQLITKSKYDSLKEKLSQNKLRIVQEHEIGLALVYCSVEVYCNPEFDLSGADTPGFVMPGPSLSQVAEDKKSETLENETESLCVSRVPETLFDHATETTSLVSDTPEFDGRKRPHSADDDNILPPVKKRGFSSKSIPADENILPPVKKRGSSSKSIADDLMFDEIAPLKKKPRPAPKRVCKTDKQSAIDSLAPSENRVSKGTHTANVSGESSANNCTEVVMVAESDEEGWDNLPDSCLDDNSLWTSTAPVTVKPNTKDTKIPKQKNNTDDLIAVSSADSHMEPVCDNTATGAQIMTEKASTQNSQTSEVVVKKESTSFDSECQAVPDANNHQLKQIPSENVIKSEFSVVDPSLPSENCTNIVHVNLVVQRNFFKKGTAPSLTEKKNFKQFFKILPTYMNAGSQNGVTDSVKPPTIIGGRDLFKHENRIGPTHLLDDWMNNQSQNSLQASQDSNPFNILKK